MTSLTIAIIIVFCCGYALIAMESLTKINKAAIALLMFVACWTLYMCDPSTFVGIMHPDFKGAVDSVITFSISNHSCEHLCKIEESIIV